MTTSAQQSYAVLADRGVVAVSGPDARHFLDNLLTVDTESALRRGAAYGGLLTPQGKILFDFIVFPVANGFLFDLPAAMAADFVRRLILYKLRANVTVTDRSAEMVVLAGPGSQPAVDGAIATDPREPRLGWRAVVDRGAAAITGYAELPPGDYAARRIALGGPEGGVGGAAIPPDADMDQLRGIAFRQVG
jgi:folate-binding Fe-S cluster repair protein YgfZ